MMVVGTAVSLASNSATYKKKYKMTVTSDQSVALFITNKISKFRVALVSLLFYTTEKEKQLSYLTFSLRIPP